MSAGLIEDIKNFYKDNFHTDIEVDYIQSELKTVNSYFIIKTKEKLQAIIEHPFTDFDKTNTEKYSQILLDIIHSENDNFNSKRLGEFTNKELSGLNAAGLRQKFIQEIENIRFDRLEERQEYLRFLSNFRSSNYSNRNKNLLFAQCKLRGISDVVGTLKEWNMQGTMVKKGEYGLTICMPTIQEYYYEVDENGVKQRISSEKVASEKKILDEKIKTGKVVKKEQVYFNYKPVIFSIDQTSMKEQDRIKYLQRYNAYNTSAENEFVLEKEKNMIQRLGIDITYRDSSSSSIGFVTTKWDTIGLKEDMPIDSQISVLTHELGHYLLHRHSDINPDGYNNIRDKKHPYALTREDMEIQAQLFSQLVLEGLGIDSESENSMKYISQYLALKNQTNDTTDTEVVKISDASANVLYTHLEIVLQEANFVSKCLNKEIKEMVSDEDIKKIQNFVPDRFMFDSATQNAYSISNSSLDKKKEEENEGKIDEKTAQDQKQQTKHTTWKKRHQSMSM